MERRELKRKGWKNEWKDLIDDIRRFVVYLTDVIRRTMVDLTNEQWCLMGKWIGKERRKKNSPGSKFPEPTVSHTASRRESGQLSRMLTRLRSAMRLAYG